MWWHNWRYLPHMKDEALSPVAFRMEELPIAEPSPAMRESAESAARRLVEITAGQQQTQRTLSGLVNQAYALTPAEIDLMWKTAPPRLPMPPPAT